MGDSARGYIGTCYRTLPLEVKTTSIFYMHIFNLEAGYYLLKTPEKALVMAETKKITITSSPVWSIGVILILWFTMRMASMEWIYMQNKKVYPCYSALS